MEILLAYAFDRPDSAARAAEGAARVEAYYGTPVQLRSGQPYEVRVPDGWVRSNRPVAALLFAGVPATPSPRGWAFAAACGWFMGDSTPYDSVLALPGATESFEPVETQTDPVAAALAEHRRTEGLSPRVAYGHNYPVDLAKVEALPTHAKLQVFSQHLQEALVPATGPSEASRAAVAMRIEQVLRDALSEGIEDSKLLDYFYQVERIQPVRRESRPRRLGESPERESIERLLLSVEEFDERALSTLWAASLAGASSGAAEATLRQALRRATFDRFLAEVNAHLPRRLTSKLWTSVRCGKRTD